MADPKEKKKKLSTNELLVKVRRDIDRAKQYFIRYYGTWDDKNKKYRIDIDVPILIWWRKKRK